MKNNLIVPLGDRILVRRTGHKTKFGDLIELPENTKTRLLINEVILVGDDMPDYFKDKIYPGVKVLTSWFTGIPVDFPEFFLTKEDYRLHTSNELVGIWRGDVASKKKKGFFRRLLDFMKRIFGFRREDGGEDKD